MTSAHVWVQWKGTDVCLDFHCVCSNENESLDFGHFDGYGAYAIKCPRCGRQYELPQTLELTLVDSPRWEPVVPPVEGYEDWDHDTGRFTA